MPKNAIKQRRIRAKERAAEILIRAGYKIIPSDNSLVCLFAVRKTEWRAVRIALDEITKKDELLIREIPAPVNCSREIWLKRLNVKDFEIREIA